MLKIGLTGNIASGKSSAEFFFNKAGFKILCLDEVTHKIYDTDLNFQIFLFQNFKTTNRESVSKLVFEDPNKLKLLESGIYPAIKKEMDIFFEKNSDKPAVIVSGAMIFESGFDKYFDKIIFVSADEELRIRRLMLRNNLTKEEAALRIASQTKEIFKIQNSNFVIHNNETLGKLEIECKKAIKALNIPE